LRLRRWILKGAAGLLRPPRDEALVDLALDLRNLLLGRARPKPEEPLSLLLRGVRESTVRGKFDLAVAEADRLTQAGIQVRRDVARRRGARAAMARAMGEAQRTAGGADSSGTERAWLERAVETDPRWLPWIPAAIAPPTPKANVVLDLMWVSLPYVDDDDTARGHSNALAQRDAGLKPIVLTRLGFPRALGIEVTARVDLVDRVPYHRLDLGAGYETAAPPEHYLSDYAWLAAEVAARERPQVLHVLAGAEGYRVGLVGLALRAHLRVPLVYEVRSLLEDPRSAKRHRPADLDEDARSAEDEVRRERERLVAAETRCMQEADVVVAPTDATRAEIVRRGVPARRIHVIASAASSEQQALNGQRYRELYELLLNRPSSLTPAASLAAAAPR
jgi:glycosyl transferase family 4